MKTKHARLLSLAQVRALLAGMILVMSAGGGDRA